MSANSKDIRTFDLVLFLHCLIDSRKRGRTSVFRGLGSNPPAAKFAKSHLNISGKTWSVDTRIWTMDLSDCSRLLYHWAISPLHYSCPFVFCSNNNPIPILVDKFWLQHPLGVGGIMVSIAAFQAVDPGSIPGRRNFWFLIIAFMSRTWKKFRYRELNPGHLGESQVS